MSTMVVSERQVRAGARVLRQLMVHPHPMVARAIRESLAELTWNDLIAFTERCEATLLEGGLEERAPAPGPIDARD